ncbi:MAG: glycosyl hydrolase family 18 protein [Ilumatobacteraceae bacterium]
MSRPSADRPGPPDTRRGPDDATGEPSAAGAERRRRTVLFSLVAALLVGALGVAWVQRSGSDDPPEFEVLGWLPYWVAEDGLASLERAGGELSVVSPFWFVALGPTTILADDHADPAETEAAMAAARASGAAVVPSILDGMDAGGMAAILRDPATRSVHVDAVIGFVEDNGFDGVDLDYEQFAFADDRSTWEATRPAWVSFVEELSAELHRRGKVLHVSVPPVYDDGRTANSGYWVYDHGAIIAVVDRLRIMTYDYSPGAPGPIAPIDWVVSSLDGTIEATGSRPPRPGNPLYGYNWFVGTTGSCAEPGTPAGPR